MLRSGKLKRLLGFKPKEPLLEKPRKLVEPASYLAAVTGGAGVCLFPGTKLYFVGFFSLVAPAKTTPWWNKPTISKRERIALNFFITSVSFRENGCVCYKTMYRIPLLKNSSISITEPSSSTAEPPFSSAYKTRPLPSVSFEGEKHDPRGEAG